MKYTHKNYNEKKLKTISQVMNNYNVKTFADKLEFLYDKLSVPIFPYAYCVLNEIQNMNYGISQESDESDLLLEMIYNNEIKSFNHYPVVKNSNPELKYLTDMPLITFANNLAIVKRNMLSEFILEKGNVLENIVFATKVNLPIYQKVKHKNLVLEKGNLSANGLYLIFNHDANIYEHYKHIYITSGDLKLAKMAQLLSQGYYGLTQVEIEEYAKYKIPIKRLTNANNKKDVMEQLKETRKLYEKAKEKEEKFLSGIAKHF